MNLQTNIIILMTAMLSQNTLTITLELTIYGVGLIGVRILVAFGGPNIYIDTFDGVVRGYWGGTQSYPLGYNVADTINDYFEDCSAENIYFDSHNN